MTRQVPVGYCDDAACDDEDCVVVCDCERGTYPSCRYRSCYECFLDRRSEYVSCIYCDRWHSPEFDTCFACRPQGRDDAARDLKLVILARDSFACRYCGVQSGDPQMDPRKVTPADDGIRPAVLHVDHIKPCSKGGTADPWNLQVLCGVCNIGKGNEWWPGCRHEKARELVQAAYLTYLWGYLTLGERALLIGEVDGPDWMITEYTAAARVSADFVQRVKTCRPRPRSGSPEPQIEDVPEGVS